MHRLINLNKRCTIFSIIPLYRLIHLYVTAALFHHCISRKKKNLNKCILCCKLSLQVFLRYYFVNRDISQYGRQVKYLLIFCISCILKKNPTAFFSRRSYSKIIVNFNVRVISLAPQSLSSKNCVCN